MEVQTQKPMGASNDSGGKTFWSIIGIVIVIVVILYLLSLFTSIDVLGLNRKGPRVDKNGNMMAQKSEWQAVFLDNGQVYFGEVENEMSDPVVLKNIYYLQVIQPLQQVNAGQQNPPSQPQLSLVELGNELHGPMSEMRINRDHILFVEDLKIDGKVVEAIERDRAEKNAKK